MQQLTKHYNLKLIGRLQFPSLTVSIGTYPTPSEANSLTRALEIAL